MALGSTFHINSPVTDVYRFDRFEVRVRERVLLRDGHRVKIQELPFRMLLVLLERPGATVPREDLVKRLWGESNYADPEDNLYTVAVKLRGALRDVASKPSFVETVPKQGYRFIGELLPVVAVLPSQNSTEDEPANSPPKPVEEAGERRQWRWTVTRLVMFAAALIAVAVLSIRIYIYVHRPLASNQDKIAVGEFINSTGDPDFNQTLTPALQVKLQESPYLTLIPERKFLPHLLKTPSPATLQNELRACNAVDGQILLRGKVLAQGSGYQLSLTAWRCSNGKELTTQEASAASRAMILPALDKATLDMRRRLGEPDGSLQRFNVPLETATTSSFAALKAFSAGVEKVVQGHESESVSDFKLAIDLDPQFALAYAQIGGIYYNAGQLLQSREYFQKAFDLRSRTTDRERLVIASLYYAIATGEIQRAVQAYELWRSLYPGDLAPANDLASAYITLGQPEKAIAPALAAIHIDPTVDAPYATLVQAYLSSGDLANARSLCNDAAREKAPTIQYHEFCFVLAYVQNDSGAMRRQLQWAKGNPGESVLIETSAWMAMYQGKLAESHRLFSEAKQNALSNGLAESAALIALDEAGLQVDLGLKPEAKLAALEAVKLFPNSATVQASAALVLARAGDIAEAEVQAKKANVQAPLDTILNSAALACVQAAIQMDQQRPEGAIQALERTRPIDFNIVTALAPAYYRGLAYLQAGRPQDAAKEFQGVLDHRAIMPYSLYVALSQLQLGRALQLSGDRVGASRSYETAAEIWKGADADFPPLQELRSYKRDLESR